jgi:hypothetical protein
VRTPRYRTEILACLAFILVALIVPFLIWLFRSRP